jgi:2-C-methyl-D-erythritol 4-phosphate cytidylyltransferase
MGGVKKEFQKLKNSPDGFTVLGSCVHAFAQVPSVETIVIAIPENTETVARNALPSGYLETQKPEILFVTGGEDRRASVFNALCALADYNPCYVLIHDGARPWVSVALIENIIDSVKKYGAVIPLVPLTDTPKECDAPFPGEREIFVKTHLKRSNTGTAQTPQGFKYPEILQAHEKAASAENAEFTDDAEIWGKFCGSPVAVIPGEQENRKITFPGDAG